MLRLLILSLVQTALVSHAMADENSARVALRYDGVYVSKPFVGDEKYCHYLRFYPKGTVITVSSVCDSRSLKDIQKWFHANNAGRNYSGKSRGAVTIKDNQISFAAVSREGEVAYEGSIIGDQLLLNSYSYINGNNGSDSYSFVKW